MCGLRPRATAPPWCEALSMFSRVSISAIADGIVIKVLPRRSGRASGIEDVLPARLLPHLLARLLYGPVTDDHLRARKHEAQRQRQTRLDTMRPAPEAAAKIAVRHQATIPLDAAQGDHRHRAEGARRGFAVVARRIVAPRVRIGLAPRRE